MKTINFLASLIKNRLAWVTLLVISLGCALSAAYFQHVLHLAPCVLCVYERVAMCGVILSALLGCWGYTWTICRWGASLIWLISCGWGIALTIEHLNYQYNPSPWNVCDIFTNFPSWLPFDQWVPSYFQAQGVCADIVWSFLSISMVQWLFIIFVCLTAANLAVVGACTIKKCMVLTHHFD